MILKNKNSPVKGWGGLSNMLNFKMSKKSPKLAVMHTIAIVKDSNSWTRNDTHNLIANDWLQWVVCTWIYLQRSSICKQIWNIWMKSKFIQCLVIWHDLTHQPTPSINPTHPTTHPQPPIHPPIGGGVSTKHKSSNRIELSISYRFIFSDLTWPTHQPTHKWWCLHKS